MSYLWTTIKLILSWQLLPLSTNDMKLSRFSGLLTCFMLIGAVAGCPGNGKVTTGNAPKAEASAEELLASAIYQLRPENYTIAAATDKPINLLNSWSERVSNSAADVEPAALPNDWIDKAESARLKVRLFDLRDAVHVRDAMLNHAIVTYLAARGTDEVSQIQSVFDFVVRNITLRSPDETDLPLGVYQLLLLGRGNAEDRAWVCGALLRQLHIDSVVVRPPGADADTWLLGVILNQQIYLFDPRMGIALPATADPAAKPGRPATLEEIVSHPEWLQPLALRADQPYAVDADGLKDAELQPIVESDYWSPRMQQLESALPANDLCVLYDPVTDEAGRTGLLSRLRNVAPNKGEQFKPWPYPHQQIKAGSVMTPAVKQAWELATQTFNLPIPVVTDRQTQQTTLGTPERRMLRIRTDQLLGKFEEATERYLSIRHLEVEPVPVQELAILNRMGAENAIYWTAICKFEEREYEAAIEQLSSYLKRYDRNGRWNFAARALLADCHGESGHFSEAIAVLERTRSDDPYREANAIRVKRWTARK